MYHFKPGSKNLISDVQGILVGNAEDHIVNTGTTVLTGKKPFTSSYKVLGGAPGSRETDLLEPDKLVKKIDAIVLSGGSAFGLESASEVANQLRKDDRGFPVGEHRVPIVPGAIIFDLTNGGKKNWKNNPYAGLAAKAYHSVGTEFEIGSYGAGKGAISGNLKGGLGSASLVIENNFTVGALFIVNSFGSVVVNGQPHFWAAPFEIGGEFGGLGVAKTYDPVQEIRKVSEEDFSKNTVIGIVATDASLSKSECKALATIAHDGIARSVFPSHTSFDGDLIFSVSTGSKNLSGDPNELLLIHHAASLCVSRAVARGVYNASSDTSDLFPTFKSKFGFKV